MVDIEIINRQIRKTVIELLFAIIIFIIALIMWLNPNTSIANIVSKNSMNKGEVALEQIKPLTINSISPISDEEAINNYDNAILRITNNQNVTSRYELIYRVNNNSTLDTKFLKFKLDNIEIDPIIDFLSNVKTKTGDNYTDYIIYTGEITPNKSLDFSFIIWIDENAGNESQGKSLSSGFVANSYNANISLK